MQFTMQCWNLLNGITQINKPITVQELIIMSTGYPITKQPCTIYDVMPSYLQEVEKEAYMMIQKYGKKRAEEVATLNAERYIEDINNLKYYNAEKIDLWNKRKFFWFEVAMRINNWT